jgi:hypothetical protein
MGGGRDAGDPGEEGRAAARYFSQARSLRSLTGSARHRSVAWFPPGSHTWTPQIDLFRRRAANPDSSPLFCKLWVISTIHKRVILSCPHPPPHLVSQEINAAEYKHLRRKGIRIVLNMMMPSARK